MIGLLHDTSTALHHEVELTLVTRSSTGPLAGSHR